MKKELIENVLNKILSELNGLLLLLNNEKELLSSNDFENIAEIAEQKKLVITNIETNDAKFKEMLNAKEYADTSKSIHDIISEKVPGSANLWAEIEQLLKTCKSKNSVNGIILSNNRRQVQQSLAILKGQSNDVLVYGSNGESVITNSLSNNPLSV